MPSRAKKDTQVNMRNIRKKNEQVMNYNPQE